MSISIPNHLTKNFILLLDISTCSILLNVNCTYILYITYVLISLPIYLYIYRQRLYIYIYNYTRNYIYFFLLYTIHNISKRTIFYRICSIYFYPCIISYTCMMCSIYIYNIIYIITVIYINIIHIYRNIEFVAISAHSFS